MNNDIKCQNYSEVPGRCNGKVMVYICNTGQKVVGSDEDGNAWCRDINIYQCEDCKTIKSV